MAYKIKKGLMTLANPGLASCEGRSLGKGGQLQALGIDELGTERNKSSCVAKGIPQTWHLRAVFHLGASEEPCLGRGTYKVALNTKTSMLSLPKVGQWPWGLKQHLQQQDIHRAGPEVSSTNAPSKPFGSNLSALILLKG